MNHGELKTAVYDRVGISTTDPQLLPAVVTRLLNDASRHISTVADWWWLQATASVNFTGGNGEASLDDDTIVRIRDVYLPDETRLDRRSVRDLLRSWAPTDRGDPEAFALRGLTIVVRPVPSAALTVTVHGQAKEVEFVDGQDNVDLLMPEPYQLSVVEYASWLATRRLREPGRAQECWSSYQQMVGAMRDDVKRGEGTYRINVRPGGAYEAL